MDEKLAQEMIDVAEAAREAENKTGMVTEELRAAWLRGVIDGYATIRAAQIAANRDELVPGFDRR